LKEKLHELITNMDIRMTEGRNLDYQSL